MKEYDRCRICGAYVKYLIHGRCKKCHNALMHGENKSNIRIKND